MILSENYNFIFVHIPKTAGLSVTDALGKYGRPRGRTLFRSLSRKLSLVESPGMAHFRVHEPASRMVSKLTRPVFDSFTSFAVIRNPFDHAVSHYEYMKQFRVKKVAKKVGKMSFQEYLEYRKLRPRGQDTVFARLPNQSYFLTAENGEMLVTNLIRFENLDNELKDLADMIGLPDCSLQHVNKTKSRSKKRSYKDYYDDDTIKLVQEIYADDFVRFEYSTSL